MKIGRRASGCQHGAIRGPSRGREEAQVFQRGRRRDLGACHGGRRATAVGRQAHLSQGSGCWRGLWTCRADWSSSLWGEDEAGRPPAGMRPGVSEVWERCAPCTAMLAAVCRQSCGPVPGPAPSRCRLHHLREYKPQTLLPLSFTCSLFPGVPRLPYISCFLGFGMQPRVTFWWVLFLSPSQERGMVGNCCQISQV